MKKYQYSGGMVGRGGPFIYVERKVDFDIYDNLKDEFNLITISAPRQCGKTSLAYGVGEQLAEDQKFRFVFVDFRIISHPTGHTIISDDGTWWFHSIFMIISSQLEIDTEILNEWIKRASKRKVSLTDQFVGFFKDFIRDSIEEPLVVVFDELDLLGMKGYYTDEFFDGLQIIFNERDRLKVSFILASIAHPSLLLKGFMTSAFKVGLHSPLPDFDVGEDTVKQWTQGLKIINKEIRYEVGNEILTQTSGQPFLTANLMHRFNEAEGKGINDVEPLIDEMVKNALNPQWGLTHFKAPLDFIVARERYAFAVLDEYKRILNAPIDINSIDEKVFAVLNTTGLTKLVDNRFLHVRSPIYRRIYNEDWCKKTKMGLGKRDWYSPLSIPSYKKREKSNICLFNTGGTVGMVEYENKMIPPQNEREFFEIYPSLRNIADIDFVQFSAKDGANIFPVDWSKIAKAIYHRRNDDYDGFVIAHGTDTMTYTASAVAFALGSGIDKPVVFVGSQTPHNVPHGDALANLARACMIASMKIPEVVISFGDEVYRAVRAEKYSDYHFKGFHSPTFAPLAVITEKIEIKKENLWIDKTGKIECKAEFEDRILQISQYPGFDPEWLDIVLESKIVKGVIIESLGIGNLPTLSESKYNLLPIIEKAIKRYEIPVIITSKYPIKPEFVSKYIPATAALQIGAISAGNMTSSAALTKIMWLLPQIEEEIKKGDLKKQRKLEEKKKLMAHSFVGEVD